MTIKERIQYIAGTLVGEANFYYGRKSDINIIGDDASFPAICLIEPDDIGLVFSNISGNLNDYDTCFIQFIDQVVMGEQAKDRLPVVDTMRTLAARFIDAVINDTEMSLRTTGDTYQIRGTLIVDQYDVNVAGIELQIPLGLVYPREIC
jgi:hypothetical protein